MGGGFLEKDARGFAFLFVHGHVYPRVIQPVGRAIYCSNLQSPSLRSPGQIFYGRHFGCSMANPHMGSGMMPADGVIRYTVLSVLVEAGLVKTLWGTLAGRLLSKIKNNLERLMESPPPPSHLLSRRGQRSSFLPGKQAESGQDRVSPTPVPVLFPTVLTSEMAAA